MIGKHKIRPDGQPASATEMEQAREWNRAGRDRAARPETAVTTSASAAADPAEDVLAPKTGLTKYKSAEFVPSDHDSSSEADNTKVQSKVELVPPKRKKRPREDHAGREATPPRRTSPRRAITPEEKRTKVSPVEPSQAPAPPRHQHPLSYKGRSRPADKGKEKAEKPAAQGAPTREPEASSSSQDEMAPKDESKVEFE